MFRREKKGAGVGRMRGLTSYICLDSFFEGLFLGYAVVREGACAHACMCVCILVRSSAHAWVLNGSNDVFNEKRFYNEIFVVPLL